MVKDKNLKTQKKNREDFLSETKAEIERLRVFITNMPIERNHQYEGVEREGVEVVKGNNGKEDKGK